MATSTTFKQFERRMAKRAKEIRTSSERTIRDIVASGVLKVVDSTPIDTGNTRRNWYMTFGTAPQSSDPSKDKPSDPAALAALRAAKDTAGAESKTKMLSTLGKWGFSQGPVINIVNQTPYVISLEQGSSTQAPKGMTKQTIAVMREKAKQLKVTLRRE